MGAINAYFCSSTRALIICYKSQQIGPTAAGEEEGRFKSSVVQSLNLWSLLTWSGTMPLMLITSHGPSHWSCFFGSQYWSVVVGGGWRENGKLSQMATHIYLRKPHLLSALLVSAMWVRPCLCLPNVGSQQQKKKSKECKWEGRKWLKSLKSARVCQRQVSLRMVIQ